MPRGKTKLQKRKSPNKRSRARRSPRRMRQYEKAYDECLKNSLAKAQRSRKSPKRKRTPPKKKSRSRKRAPSEYNKFFAKHRKQGKSPKTIGRMWRQHKGKKSPKKKSPRKRK